MYRHFLNFPSQVFELSNGAIDTVKTVLIWGNRAVIRAEVVILLATIELAWEDRNETVYFSGEVRVAAVALEFKNILRGAALKGVRYHLRVVINQYSTWSEARIFFDK